jgi:hypothetical protein
MATNHTLRRGVSCDLVVIVRVAQERPAEAFCRGPLVRAPVPQEPAFPYRILQDRRALRELPCDLQIQEDIEDRLRLYHLFYDRKKGEYRRLKKPIKKIVGMGAMAQAVMAIVLQKPDQARGRPETYVKDHAADVFDLNVDRDLYAACILLDRQVVAYLQGQGLESDEVRDIRYYVSMLIGTDWNLASRKPDAIAKGIAAAVKPIPVATLKKATENAMHANKHLGATDVVAKSPDMTKEVLAGW